VQQHALRKTPRELGETILLLKKAAPTATCFMQANTSKTKGSKQVGLNVVSTPMAAGQRKNAHLQGVHFAARGAPTFRREQT